MTTVVSIAGGIIMAMAGTIYAANVNTQQKIDEKTEALRNTDQAALQRISAVEEAVSTMKKNNDEIRLDIKEILRTLKR